MERGAAEQTRSLAEVEQEIALYHPLVEAYQQELTGLDRGQVVQRCAEVFPQFPVMARWPRGRVESALLKQYKDSLGYEELIAQHTRLCQQQEQEKGV